MKLEQWKSWKQTQNSMYIEGWSISDAGLREMSFDYYAKGLDAVPSAIEKLSVETGRSFEEVSQEVLPNSFNENDSIASDREALKYPVKDWERMVRIGILPRVVSPALYAKSVVQGAELAKAYLSGVSDPIPSEELIKRTHLLAFGGVHPWAGSFREVGQEVRVGALICSSAKDIVPELFELEKEMRRAPISGSKPYLAESIAYYHARFLVIHPFLDGNGRVSRLLLDHQTKRLLGHSLREDLERLDYFDALSQAQQKGDLGKLTEIILMKGQ